MSNTIVEDVFNFGVNLRTNEIYLGGAEIYGSSLETAEPGVEYIMANNFIKGMRLLENKGAQEITIHMNTIGGHWHHGMAIYDCIATSNAYITIINYAEAQSMSSLIYQAADYRIMMPHSCYMIHQGSDGFEGTWKQFQTQAALSKVIERQMMTIYVDTLKTRSKKFKSWSKARIEAWLLELMHKREEVYFTAKEAVELGFADRIL